MVANRKDIAPEEFAAMDALERIRWVGETYGDKALLLSSMQRTSSALMHMIHRAGAPIVILFVDTQFHFQETLDVRDAFIERYGLDIRTAYPELNPEQQREKFGCELYQYVDGQPECCRMRKEEPFLKVARELKIEATLAGLMQAEGGARSRVQPIGFDPRIDARVFHPIYDWDYARLEAYLREHDVPVNKLHGRGYPSIGCAPCTTPVEPGEDPRAGRWRHLRKDDGQQPQYCNINYIDRGAGI